MSQNSLPSLSHTTHTPNPTAHVCQTTDGIDEGDDEAEANSGGGLHRSEKSPEKDSIEITHRIHKEFDFNEFYDLAMKALNGDPASLERLNSLQDRWQEKLQSTVEESSAAKLLPRHTVLGVPTPTVTPLPLDDGQATPILTEEGETGDQVSHLATCHNSPPSTSIDCAQEIFIGNIKLQPNPVDTIASAFLQSSRKILQFVPPSIEKGEIIIQPSPAIVRHGSQRWHSTAVGYFLGRKPYFPHLESYVRSNWFKTRAAMEEIIERSSWLFQGQPIVLQCWEQDMSLRRQKHTQIPVWVRLKHLPMEYWTDDGLGTIASGVGIPLYTDKITKNCSRIDYARVCVMLDYNSTLPKHLIFMNPLMQESHEVPVKIDIEYEWLPQRCKTCFSLGHTTRTCPDNKKGEHIHPMQVFVKKQLASVAWEKAELQADMQRAEAPEPSVLTAANKKLDAPLQRAAGDNSPRPVSNKGKSIVLFNPFDILDADCSVQELETTPAIEHTSSGPNISSPDLAGT
ncbi:UNVERIFIED_CONTAM: hypothetical protein Sangu_2749600 [Sesamum angustifolium]|uniref:DUF4283 domain-containing protein n=1 Tax=Sesamum angustifolium TaxID=2727405 RepID=A0AAW2IVE3_9LAMI